MKREERIKLLTKAFDGMNYRDFKATVETIELAFYPPKRKELTSENINSELEDRIGLFKN